ncbi:MAG TPA: alpha/beta hydrolase [Verrucomicrobiae bacterium]|jgi:pimeloyl-ACP methyl ester carboxylesterase|nr:alpha/beta hydrolase [Verrucomicrobiae bacterium]
MKNKDVSEKSVVLVHGAFADASSWRKIIPLLEKEGITVTAVQLPLKSLADDVATTKRVIENQHGEVILVGHSYGGAVITEAGAGNPAVKGLVYVAAFAPDEGEALTGLMERFAPSPLGTAVVPDSAGFLYIDRAKFAAVFANDLPKEESSLLAATQKPLAAPIFGEIVKAAAWKNIPSWYVVSTQDNAINPDLERFMAKRIGAKTQELKASHVSFISNPVEIAKVISAAVAGN